jgi:hypothetical protein
VDILSSMAPATLAADQKIFAALLAHIKAVDAQQNTVLMVQVENEIGMLPVARDYGPQADAAYRGQVPAELMSLSSSTMTLWSPPCVSAGRTMAPEPAAHGPRCSGRARPRKKFSPPGTMRALPMG